MIISSISFAGYGQLGTTTWIPQQSYGILDNSGRRIKLSNGSGTVTKEGSQGYCLDKTHKYDGTSVVFCEDFNGPNLCFSTATPLLRNCQGTFTHPIGYRYEMDNIVTFNSTRNLSSLPFTPKGDFLLDIMKDDLSYADDMIQYRQVLTTPITTGISYVTFYVNIERTNFLIDGDGWSQIFQAGDFSSEYNQCVFNMGLWLDGSNLRFIYYYNPLLVSPPISTGTWYRIGIKITHSTGAFEIYSNTSGTWQRDAQFAGYGVSSPIKDIWGGSFNTGKKLRFQIARIVIRSDDFEL